MFPIYTATPRSLLGSLLGPHGNRICWLVGYRGANRIPENYRHDGDSVSPLTGKTTAGKTTAVKTTAGGTGTRGREGEGQRGRGSGEGRLGKTLPPRGLAATVDFFAGEKTERT